MPRFNVRAVSVLFTCLALSATAEAQNLALSPPNTPPLTLEEAIARAMSKNFSLQLQGYSSDQARETLVIARAGFDPTFTASLSRSGRADASATSLLDGTTREGPRSDTTTTQVGISELLPTGGTVSVTSNLGRSASNSSNSLLNPNYSNSIAVNLSHPLLKNFGTTVTRAGIRRGEFGVTNAALNYKSAVLTVIRDTENAYHNLVSARETLRIRLLSFDLAQKLFDENTARRLTGIMTDLDVLQAELGVANARSAIVQAEQTVRNAEDSLVGLFVPDNFDSRPGEVTFSPFSEPPPSVSMSYKLALDNQPDYQTRLTAVKQAELERDVARRNRLPQLNLTAGLGYNANAPDSYSNVVDTFIDRRGNNWNLGLNFSMPWRMKADNARYRSANSQLNAQKTQLAQFEQTTLLQVRSAVRAVETNVVRVEIATKSTAVSVKQYELQKARFDAGLATSRLVLEAQSDLEDARVAELSAKVLLRSAIAELHRLEGTSLQRFNIVLP